MVFLQGGGIGIDQEASVRAVLDAAQAPLKLKTFLCGQAALDNGQEAIPEEVTQAIRDGGIALKTKLLAKTKPHVIPANYNVELRRKLGMFASVRPIHNLRGLKSRFDNVDFLLIREISEDLYATSEHEIVPGVVQSFKIVTEMACLRFFRFAFAQAAELGKKSVHCIHKANILKMADGLFLDCFRQVAKEFPEIEAKDMIVDNACMQMVSRPHQFEVVVAGNLYGDLLSDLGAGLVGGISATSAVNYGPGVKMYEAVYGATLEQIPANRANPLPLLLPTVHLLKDIGEVDKASRILHAIENVLEVGNTLPADLAGTASTTEFTAALVEAVRKG